MTNCQFDNLSMNAKLLELAADYWACADGDADKAIGDLFTDDGVLVLGKLTLTGRAEIERFFKDREVLQQASKRSTRHVACNHRIKLLDPGRARVRSTVIVYVGVGPPPLPSDAPAGIADFDDICVETQAGEWRFARREGRTVFVGPGAASFAK
jgi:hypothetical protein